MMKNNRNSKIAVMLSLLMMAAMVLSACQPSTPAPTQDNAAIQTQAAQTVVADLTANAPPPAEPTQAPTATLPPPGPTPDPNLPVAVVPTPAPGEPAAIANYNTGIYSGPGENYVFYASFLGSSTAKVIGVSEDGAWWVVSVPPAPNGQGWVSAAWVTVQNADGVPAVPTPPVPPTTELVPPGPDDPQATALANVYVRTGPGSNFPAYGIATTGANARVIGVSEDSAWWVVRLNPENVGAGYGWVMAQYTQSANVEGIQTIASPEPPVTIPPEAPPTGVPVAMAVDFVNVRSGPGTNYPVLGVASPGASAEVSGVSADGAWWQVIIPTQYAADAVGWVSASFAVTANTESVPVVEAPPAPPVVETTPPAQGEATGCRVAGQDPADGTVFAAGSSFTTTWVLENSGTDSWNLEYDLVFVGAASNVPLHQGTDRYDLSANVEPGWTYNFSVPMITPFDAGTYGEVWQVVFGNQPVCEFYVYVQVQ